MITRVTVANPISWLEQETKEVKDGWMKSSLFPTSPDDYAYELSVPDITNRPFEFKPGLNVIVGPNGSGKTSLLNLISQIVCCHRDPSSTYRPDAITKTFQQGVYACCEVKANYDISSFRLISGLPSDNSRVSFATDIANLKSRDKSDGQADIIRIQQLLDYFNNDGAILNGDAPMCLKDFRERVGKHINDEATRSMSTLFELVSGYYVDNSVSSDDAKAVSFILDCPDANLDIPNLKLLYNLFLTSIRKQDKIQFIVSLNSSLLIKSLIRITNVNWIDIVPGYLEAVIKNQVFIPPEVTNKKKGDEKKNDKTTSNHD